MFMDEKKHIRYSGHTMGTPGLNIYQSLEFMKSIGYDGIEVRIAANGQIDSETVGDEEVFKIKKYADSLGLKFSCLTPYYKDLVTDARVNTINQLKRVIEIASSLECPLVRVYGGMDPGPQGIWFVDNWTKTVSGIKEIGKYAASMDVGIAIETHLNSLTMSIRDTVRMVQDINLDNIGILFDYAWVELAGVERGKEAVNLAARHIVHCHVKDWQLESRTPLKKKSCLLGEGTIGWDDVLKELRKIGYAGWITDEYEKFWYPDELPPPEIGMKRNLEFLRKRLEHIRITQSDADKIEDSNMVLFV